MPSTPCVSAACRASPGTDLVGDRSQRRHHPGRTADSFPPTRDMILAMRRHCAEFGLRLYDIDDRAARDRACDLA